MKRSREFYKSGKKNINMKFFIPSHIFNYKKLFITKISKWGNHLIMAKEFPYVPRYPKKILVLHFTLFEILSFLPKRQYHFQIQFVIKKKICALLYISEILAVQQTDKFYIINYKHL
jgi:hypothetical protein